MKNGSWLLLGYFVLIISLIVYSYTQVDLNLTLSSNHLYQSIQYTLTHVGYFNRPLSTTLFLILIAGSFGFYFLVLHLVQKKLLSLTQIKWLIGLSLLLLFAYPAFSHDLYNYMFDARIVTKYGLDPHYFRALDFPSDTWTRFMRWTHRYYPYGPGWLMLSQLPSYLGMGKFILTLGWFKLMFGLFHILNCLLIYKIAERMHKPVALFVLNFFAFNPLVLVESLLSPHNEVMMLALAFLGCYFLLTKKTALSVVALIASISIKYLSGVLIPLLWWRKPTDKKLYVAGFIGWLLGLAPLMLLREPYPWYFVPLVGVAALSGHKWIQLFTVSTSAGLLVRYAPFLWTGEYTDQTMYMQTVLMVTMIIGIFIISHFLWKKD